MRKAPSTRWSRGRRRVSPDSGRNGNQPRGFSTVEGRARSGGPGLRELQGAAGREVEHPPWRLQCPDDGTWRSVTGAVVSRAWLHLRCGKEGAGLVEPPDVQRNRGVSHVEGRGRRSGPFEEHPVDVVGEGVDTLEPLGPLRRGHGEGNAQPGPGHLDVPRVETVQRRRGTSRQQQQEGEQPSQLSLSSSPAISSET
jgi:hypothetical protein